MCTWFTFRCAARFPTLSLAVAISLAWVGFAEATVHDWVVQGTVTHRSGSVFAGQCLGSATVGAAFRYDFAYDDTATDAEPHPSVGIFASTADWQIRFPNSADSLIGTDLVIAINDDTEVGPGVGFDAYQAEPAPGLLTTPGCAMDPAGIEFDLYEDGTLPLSAITSDQLSTTGTPPNVADFTDFHQITIYAGDGTSFITMEITSFENLGSAAAPVLPISGTVTPNWIQWQFNTTCTSFCWIDPPMASGFFYETDGNSLFTSIDDFPPGFGADFEVITGGSSVGFFGPGDSVDFSGEPGGGVVSFLVRGITPAVDASDEVAFPLQLSLDSSPASFTMTSVPTTGVPGLSVHGAVALALALSTAACVAVWAPWRRQS